MSKRTGAIALACSAVLAVGFFGKIAYAADPVAPATPTPAPIATPAVDAGPTSVLNEYGLNKMGAGKFLADAGIKVGGYVEGSYTYNFRGLEYVRPTGVGVLDPVPQFSGVAPTDRFLTMTSCNPMFSASERIVAYAALDSWQPISAGAPAAIVAALTAKS